MAIYAVRIGRTPGVYKTWDECKEQTQGYPGAVFKKFADCHGFCFTEAVHKKSGQGKKQGEFHKNPSPVSVYKSAFEIDFCGGN